MAQCGLSTSASVIGGDAVRVVRRSGRRRWVVGEFMAVMMTVRPHQTPHQMPHHWKKFEKSLEADKAPGQEVAGRRGADNSCSEGSSLSS